MLLQLFLCPQGLAVVTIDVEKSLIARNQDVFDRIEHRSAIQLERLDFLVDVKGLFLGFFLL